MDKVDQYLEKMGLNEFEKFTPLKQLADKLNVKASYLGLGGILILVILIILEIGSFMLSSLIGFAYPAYMSFKAIQTKEKDDDTQWLTYWVVFSFFTIFNQILYGLLYFIPFFYLIKVVFFIWLYHPQTQGAILIYNKFIAPLLLKHEKTIDEKFHEIKGKGQQLFEKQREKLIQ